MAIINNNDGINANNNTNSNTRSDSNPSSLKKKNNMHQILENLKYIFRRKLFISGLIINIISLFVVLSLNEDLNDMNQLVLLAIQRLCSGQNPYEYGYQYPLSIEGINYLYHLGYPPIALLIYLPVILYPVEWGVWDFNIIMFIENFIFNFLTVYLFANKNRRFSTYLILIYWNMPFLAYMEYVTFFSALFFFMFASVYYIDDPFKSGLFIGLAIGMYHLTLFMLPILLIYQFRTYSGHKEAAEDYIRRYKANNNIKLNSRLKLKQSLNMPSLINAHKRILNDLKKNYGKILKFILGLAPTVVIILPFIFWDFNGFKYHLLEASAQRYSLDIWQAIIFLIILIFAYILLLIEKKYIAKVWAITSILLIFFMEATYLYIKLGFKYPHYFALMIPFGFFIFYVIVYDLRIYRIIRNTLEPSLLNKKWAKKFDRFDRSKGNIKI
ncbi:MAG: hypothetical protein ACTSU2_12375 [Promethearchaeota archaeon]